MSVQILYFASLREAFGIGSERLDLPGGIDNVAALRDWLVQAHGRERLATARNLRCAVNQDMVGFDAAIRDGDEIAFFPPVTGG